MNYEAKQMLQLRPFLQLQNDHDLMNILLIENDFISN